MDLFMKKKTQKFFNILLKFHSFIVISFIVSYESLIRPSFESVLLFKNLCSRAIFGKVITSHPSQKLPTEKSKEYCRNKCLTENRNHIENVLCVFLRVENTLKTCSNCIYKTLQNSLPEVFLKKGVLKICSKFTRKHLCRSAISSLQIRCIFSENLFLRTSLEGCF